MANVFLSEENHFPRQVTLPLLTLSSIYDRVFGPNPFSRQALRRACIFGALLLGATLGVYGLVSGKPFAMNMAPWESLRISTDYLRNVAAQPSIQQQPQDAFFIAQNAADLAQLRGWPMAVVFTLYFAFVLVLSTGLLLSASVAVSRLFLREMVSAETPFRIFVLLFSSTMLLFAVAIVATLLLFVLLNVWTWPLIPLLFGLSKLSLLLGAGIATAVSLLAWFFSAPGSESS